jgi:hypothetical protein
MKPTPASELRAWGIRVAREVGLRDVRDSDDEVWEQIVESCGFPPEGTEWHDRLLLEAMEQAWGVGVGAARAEATGAEARPPDHAQFRDIIKRLRAWAK